MSWAARVAHPTGGSLKTGGVVRPEAALKGHHQLAGSRLVPVLAEPDPLPCAQRETALADGQREGRAEEAGLDMGRLDLFVFVVFYNIVGMGRRCLSTREAEGFCLFLIEKKKRKKEEKH